MNPSRSLACIGFVAIETIEEVEDIGGEFDAGGFFEFGASRRFVRSDRHVDDAFCGVFEVVFRFFVFVEYVDDFANRRDVEVCRREGGDDVTDAVGRRLFTGDVSEFIVGREYIGDEFFEAIGEFCAVGE